MTDWRLPASRREAWQRNYTHMLRYRNAPGCVYFALPALAQKLNWDAEERFFASWLNANTQNPVTTQLLMEQGSLPRDWRKVAAYQQREFASLAWDTDRRYFKTSRVFTCALAGYAEIMEKAGSQHAYWSGVKNWDDAWHRMTALPYMGRLSAWSGLEYVRLLGDQPVPDADTLMLNDASGSRSHRNALALLAGYDGMLQDVQLNPGYAGKWEPDFVQEMRNFGAELLAEAYERNDDRYAGYLTAESALCQWKSWSKRNRRYPNVYADMMHDRLRWAEARHGRRFDVLWDARREALPAYLRLEDSPGDPGLRPEKQNVYRETGEVILLGHEPGWPDMWSQFDQNVTDGKYGRCR